MQSMAQMTESFKHIFEGYYGTKRTSYTPQGKAKIIIKHNKNVSENDKRYHNISSIFVENTEGERFKLPFKKIAGARAMARHVTEGGNPYDMFGMHINELVENINLLGSFVRKTPVTEDEETTNYINASKEHYNNSRKTLRHLAGKRGYKEYFESWTPDTIQIDEEEINKIKSLFKEQELAETMPTILARASRNIKPMAEEEEFNDWANNIISGNDILTDDAIKDLQDFFAIEQPFGIDAINVKTKLFDIISDEDLMAELSIVADEDPDADARDTVESFLETVYPDIYDKIKTSFTKNVEPPSIENIPDEKPKNESINEWQNIKEYLKL